MNCDGDSSFFVKLIETECNAFSFPYRTEDSSSYPKDSDYSQVLKVDIR
mgnify:CR=1 FL=1